PYIVVSRVVPTADVQIRYVLPGRKGRIGIRTHRITVEVGVVRRRLTGIIHMRHAVPHPVVLANLDMVHLDGQVCIQRALPYTFLITVGRYSDRTGGVATVFDGVDPLRANGREVDRGVLIRRPLPPWLIAAWNTSV